MAITAMDVAVISMIFDMGWKLYAEKTKNMTSAELDAFIHNKEQSISDIENDLALLYGRRP
jgi:hypothetical protein